MIKKDLDLDMNKKIIDSSISIDVTELLYPNGYIQGEENFLEYLRKMIIGLNKFAESTND